MALGNVDQIFGCYAIVEQSTGLTVGTIDFFGAPDAAGTAMIGYGLVPSARGVGYATGALLEIVAFSFAQEDIVRLEADPDRDNVASHRVLEKSGFVRTRSTPDAYVDSGGRSTSQHSPPGRNPSMPRVFQPSGESADGGEMHRRASRPHRGKSGWKCSDGSG